MTTVEKAKAYDRAIEKAKTLYNSVFVNNDVLEQIFPELGESEDERIRKALIHLLSNVNIAGYTGFYKEAGITCDEAIAYLERQKEQIVIKQNIIDSIRANTQPDWDFSTIPNLHKEISRFFGEKFVLPHTEDTVITVSDVIRCAYHFYKFGQQEQKPAGWSEEDKRKFNRIYEILGMAADTHAYSTTCRLIGDKEAIELQDFLCSIAKPLTDPGAAMERNKF